MSKKNLIVKATALMAALTLSTSCFVGGTFAKYVSSSTGSDTARVANWGVTVSASAETFAKEYETDDTAVKAKGVITNSVVSTDNVVAPGTSGKMVAIEITGIPEVAVEVSYSADLKLSNWSVGSTYYCPLVIKVNATEFNGLNYIDEAAFEKDVEDAINTYTKEYEAGTNLANVDAVDDLIVSWSWPFEGTAGSVQTDAKDTALGTAANAEIELELTATVTQID